MQKTEIQIDRLLGIMKELRKSCPWDRQQTPESLRQYLLEEVFEVIETIDEKKWTKLQEELGDLLLQIIFQSAIAEEQKRFGFNDVIQSIIDKMIQRHPHVFGNVAVNSAQEVADNWEHIKMSQEKRPSLLAGVPFIAPQLLRSQRLQEKAAKVGFDWSNKNDVLVKVEEELRELKHAIQHRNQAEIEEEIGDFLFSIVNLCRFLNIVAEDVLRLSNAKFIARFQKMESHFNNDHQRMKRAGLAELDQIWEKIKNESRE